jgi:VWFA-related protein
MHALVYPVFLLSGERFGRNWSKKAQRNMQELADASGGRLFPAESIQDLEPVFPLVEAELRSVYSVAYYPENQNFEGGWRSVQVKVKGPGMKVRARPGYYAK